VWPTLGSRTAKEQNGTQIGFVVTQPLTSPTVRLSSSLGSPLRTAFSVFVLGVFVVFFVSLRTVRVR